MSAGEPTREQLDDLSEDESVDDDPDEFQFVEDDDAKDPDERGDPEP